MVTQCENPLLDEPLVDRIIRGDCDPAELIRERDRRYGRPNFISNVLLPLLDLLFTPRASGQAVALTGNDPDSGLEDDDEDGSPQGGPIGGG